MRLGAQIMGLGAFTKVVGDAGLTVAKRSPLPITTGNSYSASGALWAAHDALLRMRLPAKAAEEVYWFRLRRPSCWRSRSPFCWRHQTP
jgi:hypothetical protein